MNSNTAETGTRGSIWLSHSSRPGVDATASQDPSSSSSAEASLQPCFSNRLGSLHDTPVRPSPCPLEIFPAWKSETADESDETASSSSVPFLRAHYPEFQDLPDEVLADLVADDAHQRSQKRGPISQTKALMTSSSSAEGPILFIAVGGPEDRQIFVSALHAPKPVRARRPRKRQAREGKAVLRQSLSPAYASSHPISSIELAPANPSVPASILHSGPWISIRTASSIHICAVHHATSPHKSFESETAYRLSHICTFTSTGVAEASTAKSKGRIFTLLDSAVSSLTWDPSSKTSAVVIDVAGHVWRWEIEFGTGVFRPWVSQGQKISYLGQVGDSSACPRQIVWVNEFTQDQVLALDHTCIYVMDLQSGQSEPLFECPHAKRHLTQTAFLAVVSLNLPSALADASDIDARVPLLIAVTSEHLLIFDVYNPRRRLLSIPHLRPIWDDTLQLSIIPSNNNIPSTASILLTSQKFATATVFTFGLETALNASGQEQATRVWQAHPPMSIDGIQGNVSCFCWKALIPQTKRWARWRVQSLDGRRRLGRWGCLTRSRSARVQLLSLHMANRQQDALEIEELPIEVPMNLAVEEIRKLLTASKGHVLGTSLLTASHPNSTGLSYDFSRVYSRLRFSDAESSAQDLSQSIDRMSEGSIFDDPANSMITALDLFALASLQSSSTKSLTPFASPLGLVSATFHPHNALSLVSKSPALLQSFFDALSTCAGHGWFDDDRRLLPRAPQIDSDESANTSQSLPDKVQHMLNSFGFSSASATDSSSVAFQKAASMVALHLTLSAKIWSSRAIQIEEPASLASPDPAREIEEAGLQTTPSRKRRLERVPLERSRVRRRQDSVGPVHKPATAQDPETNEFVEDVEEDPDIQARQRMPEPEPIHFAYFQPKSHRMGSDPTTLASRLLLSSWTLDSLDPTSASCDPSYYTWSDPYALMDAAKRSATEGYASSVSATSDGESGGWSTGRSFGATSVTSGHSGRSDRSRSRSQSVWGGVSHPSSSQLALPHPDFGSDVASTSRWARSVAPPSIGRREASISSQTPASQPLSTSLTSQPRPINATVSQASVAAQEPPSQARARPQRTIFQPSKKAKKRMGGF